MVKQMGRREFSVKAATALLGGAAITVSGCGSNDATGPSNPVPSTRPGDKVGSVASNHGHIAVITAAQLTAGGGLSLDIRGNATHNHTVVLSGSDIAQIRGGTRLSIESGHGDRDNHKHMVTFN